MKEYSRNRRYVLIGLCLLILVALPFGIYIAQTNSDLRPKALTGQANFHLSTTSQSATAGQEFDVLVTVDLTNPTLRVSGVDASVLYDKSKLEVISVTPSMIAFTDTPISDKADTVDATFNRVRIVNVARKADAQLSGGTIQIGTIRFHAISAGAAVIKFPDGLTGMEVVGTSV